MAYVTAAMIMGGGSLAAGYLGSQAASKAAKEQAAASRYAADLQMQQFQTTNRQGAPVRAAGYGALNTLGSLGSGTYNIYDAEGKPTGITGTGSGYFTQQYTPEEFAKGIDPGYQFRLSQGQEATNRAANMGGGMISGNALRGVQDYTQGLASNEFTGAFNRFQTGRTNIYNTLAGIAGLGQQSLNTTANAGTTAAQNAGNAIQAAGAAQAAGTVGSANAMGGGIVGAGQGYMLSQILGNRNQVPAGYVDSTGFAGGGSGVVNVPGQGTMPISEYFRPA
jgi:hypothetical protein